MSNKLVPLINLLDRTLTQPKQQKQKSQQTTGNSQSAQQQQQSQSDPSKVESQNDPEFLSALLMFITLHLWQPVDNEKSYQMKSLTIRYQIRLTFSRLFWFWFQEYQPLTYLILLYFPLSYIINSYIIHKIKNKFIRLQYPASLLVMRAESVPEFFEKGCELLEAITAFPSTPVGQRQPVYVARTTSGSSNDSNNNNSNNSVTNAIISVFKDTQCVGKLDLC